MDGYAVQFLAAALGRAPVVRLLLVIEVTEPGDQLMMAFRAHSMHRAVF